MGYEKDASVACFEMIAELLIRLHASVLDLD